MVGDLRVAIVRLFQDRSRIPRKERPLFGRYLLVATGWVGLLAAGFGGLLKYESVPGARSTNTPVENAEFADGKSFALVMALHPHCPCSKASVGELTKIYSHANNRIKITVLAFKPKDEPDSWIKSSTVSSLAKMNPRIVVDADGAAAKRLGLGTSGEVLLYSPNGKLLFSGGITSARAHAGDNLGEDTILELVQEGHSHVNSTEVFGCPITEQSKAQ
jgi:hypothetical protein